MSPAPEPSTLSSTRAVSPPVKPTVTGGRDGGATMVLPTYLTANTRNSISITNTKGLLNMPGQNNCFLNSAVQVLWHLDIFRRSFRDLNGHTCMSESCIFCALKELFAQFQYSQESALPPDALRRALAETFCDQRRFQLGFMDDAAECFENILLRIHFHIANKESEDMCSADHCIPHQKFAMTLVEQTVCYACGATSEPLPFTQMVHYVPSSALCSQVKVLKCEKDGIYNFGELLKKAGGLGDLRDCPSACGTVIQIRKTLMNRPEIVSIGLVWDSERPTLDHIMDVFSTIGMTLKLQDVFHSVVDSRWASSATHQLVGIVTYYGKHYSTFFFHSKLRVWIYFDDAAVREIGPKWEQVVEKCYRGHFQPLLLLYANPYGSSISVTTAPNDVTVMTHNKAFNGKNKGGTKISDTLHQNHNIPLEKQRRAVTPNPETSCDVNASIQPRRAVTPNGEVLHSSDNDTDTNNTHKPSAIENRFATNNLSSTNSDDQCNMPNYLAYQYQLWKNKCISDNLEKTGAKCDAQEEPGCTANNCWSFLSHSPTFKNHAVSDLNVTTDKVNETPNIVESNSVLKLSNVCNSDCDSFSSQGISVDQGSVHSDIYDEDCIDGKTYINRKTVENVLNLQKLQRQKSVSAKHNRICLNQRNSNSSLESIENSYLVQDRTLNHILGLKLDMPDSVNVPRKRDSGNWSGDRNSASSSSTTSLDNPYFYSTGNKRNVFSGRVRSSSVPDSTASTDLGYDSFSLSSTDSYPSVIAFAPGKNESRLGLILENQQAAFISSGAKSHQYIQDVKKNDDGNAYGFRDECKKLCIEADIFLAKSVERENIGDIAMASLLSDRAAAKAKSAIDVPYSNPHSLSLAKLKYSTCVIRSCNLHKKMKEAMILEQQKRDKMYNMQQTYLHGPESKNAEQNVSQKLKNLEQNNHLHVKELVRSNTCHKYGDSQEKTDKAIEIYATLPRKCLRKKSGLLSFVETFTGDETSSDKNLRQKSNESGDERQNADSISLQNDTTNMQSNVTKSNFENGLINKKKSFMRSNSPSKDSDVNDSNEWEHTQKISLYRTLSGPSCYGKLPSTEGPIEGNRTSSAQSPKKQHKIRRKLMGGFMRRKNRSLPDLREGQDHENNLSRSLDDCVIQISSPQKTINDKNIQEGIFTPVYIANVPIPNKSFERFESINSNVHDVPIKHTPSFSSPNISKIQGFRTHTPPPYKPPPPISTLGFDLDAQMKRNLLHNKETYNKMPALANATKTSTSSTSQMGKELIRKAPILIGKNNQLQSDVRCEIFLTALPPKHNTNSVKCANRQEMPKGSAIWLKELQIKQEEMIQKKKLQEETLRHHKITSVSSIDNSSSNIEHKTFEVDRVPKSRNGDQADVTCSLSDDLSLGSLTLQKNSNKENDASSSVKNLAMKYEGIITRPSVDVVDAAVSAPVNEIVCQPQESDKSGSPITSESKCSTPTITSECDNKIQQKVVIKESLQSIKDFSPKCSIRSYNSCVYKPYLTDGHLSNMLRIGENCATFRSNKSKLFNYKEIGYINVFDSVHKDEKLFTEIRRPEKPPDYETAIQRLELIRSDRNFFKNFDINYLSGLDSCTFDGDRKKRGSKKCVTFSDKVVLVACAGDEDNDFIPNPLLERVYKQHLMQKSSDCNENKCDQNVATCSSSDLCTAQVTDVVKHSPECIQMPCNLCHSKLIILPSIYCSDCAFYMSRFQK